MAYPGSGYPITGSSLQVTPCGPLVEQYNELNFRNLYLHQLYLGPNPTQSAMLAANAATGLGATTVNNWPIYDGLAGYSSVVARARGLHTYAGDWHNSFTIVFEDQRFRGSTLLVMGVSVEDGEWGIVGGTGQFAMARGVIQKRLHQRRNDGNIIEITIHGFCPVPRGSQTLPMGPSQQYPMPVYNSRPTKVGPWGGTGGTPHDINAPQRLESITIRHGWTIDSISFSYTDQAGQWRSVGPWGSSSGGETTMIQLGPSEYVMEVSGTYGPYNNNVVVTSLRVATNLRAYGPFGRAEGTSFTANGRVVGFFGRSGDLLDSIGVYTA